MKTCLVSLVSDQTIPNILAIAQFKPEFLVFITTEAMEEKEKTRAMLATLKKRNLNYDDVHVMIKVLENSIVDVQEKVTQWIKQSPEQYEFIVNLTGGNKLMSLAAYDFFKELGSEMIYVPIPKNEYLVPFPKLRPKPSGLLQQRLTVAEYLTAYGFIITNQDKLDNKKFIAQSRRQVSVFLFDFYADIEPVLSWLRKSLLSVKDSQWKRGYDFTGTFVSQNEAQREALDRLNLSVCGNKVTGKISKKDWEYIRGGWLEERVFLALKDALPPEADVQLSLECKDPKGNKSEFDVIFTLNNILYLVECKSLGAPEGDEERMGGTINDFLYKLGALRQNFGITPTAFLATTSPTVLTRDGAIKPHLVDRGRQVRTKIIPLLRVPDLEAFFRNEFSGRI